MNLSQLQPTQKVGSRKRVGRGPGSGHGKTSGRGMNGQGQRSGGRKQPGFEGGQTPLFKRLPKRGFHNHFKKQYAIVNVGELNQFRAGSIIDFARLQEAGLVNKQYDGLKILGNGEVEKNFTVKAHKFSQTAADKITKAGGKIEVV